MEDEKSGIAGLAEAEQKIAEGREPEGYAERGEAFRAATALSEEDPIEPEPEPEPAAMPIWLLQAVNDQEPPFHFTGVPVELIIAAEDAEAARRLAAGDAGQNGAVWLDDEMSSCEELRVTARMVIARETVKALVPRPSAD